MLGPDEAINSFMDSLNIKSSSSPQNFSINQSSLNNSKNQKRPIPMDKEINLDPKKTIMSKTDPKGVIEYANEYFMEISGYEEWELMGQPHNIIRHPDMPRTIFKLMWDTIKKGENIHAFVKNMAKDGRYYWVLTNFEFKKDEEGNIISYYARRKAAPRNAIHEIERLYNTLRAIEAKQDMQTAVNYFYGMLEEKRMTYNQFILSILGVNQQMLTNYFYDQKQVVKQQPTQDDRKKGLFDRMFS